MKTPNVIIHSNEPDVAAAEVRRVHPDLDLITSDSFAELPPLIAETKAEVVYSVRFDSATPYPRDAVVESDFVKWLAVGGSGTDHLGQWDPGNVTVTNSAGVAADMMAEYAIGAMLSFSLDLRGFHAAQKRHDWMPQARVPGHGAAGQGDGPDRSGRAGAPASNRLC